MKTENINSKLEYCELVQHPKGWYLLGGEWFMPGWQEQPPGDRYREMIEGGKSAAEAYIQETGRAPEKIHIISPKEGVINAFIRM